MDNLLFSNLDLPVDLLNVDSLEQKEVFEVHTSYLPSSNDSSRKPDLEMLAVNLMDALKTREWAQYLHSVRAVFRADELPKDGQMQKINYITKDTSFSAPNLQSILSDWLTLGRTINYSLLNESPFTEEPTTPTMSALGQSDLLLKFDIPSDPVVYRLSPPEDVSDVFGDGYHRSLLKKGLYSTTYFLIPRSLKPLAGKVKRKLFDSKKEISSFNKNPVVLTVTKYSAE